MCDVVTSFTLPRVVAELINSHFKIWVFFRGPQNDQLSKEGKLWRKRQLNWFIWMLETSRRASHSSHSSHSQEPFEKWRKNHFSSHNANHIHLLLSVRRDGWQEKDLKTFRKMDSSKKALACAIELKGFFWHGEIYGSASFLTVSP